ncbi:MAG: hypothetical protein NZ533_02715 [Casimicrobiaceae bacterium]|nr:hypothetical protein [Casimicrobiaceae bacterium]
MNEARSWLLIWAAALAIAGAAWVGFERYWRAQGYVPTVVDDKNLWSLKRARAVRPAPPTRVALLGASRIQYGLSPAAMRDEARKLGLDIDPIMLAVNGHYPLAALRDLSDDPKFTGIAIVGIDARGFHREWRDMQQKHVDYYHQEFTPAKALHRRLLTPLQERFIAARPDFAWVTLLNRWWDGLGPPWKEYVTFARDRSGATDYYKSDLRAIREARVAELRKYYPMFTPPTPEAWLAANLDVIDWVRRIQARGGQVVFYREPVSDEHFEMDEARFPRARTWDELARRMPAPMIDFQDHPELNIPTPDTSHIDARDIERHSRALVQVLRKLGVW